MRLNNQDFFNIYCSITKTKKSVLNTVFCGPFCLSIFPALVFNLGSMQTCTQPDIHLRAVVFHPLFTMEWLFGHLNGEQKIN